MDQPTHVPVMLRECLEYLAIRPDGIYLECTAGLGGHTRAIAEQLTTGLLIACDRDAESLELARANTAAFADRIHFYQASFTELERTLQTEEVSQLDKVLKLEKTPGSPLQVDGLLADLGVSRYQLTNAERGFSLMTDGELDMRMNRNQPQTAADLVNFESEKELADLIYKFGEERRSRKIARAIVRARPITSTGHLAKVIEQAVPRTGKLHPATQTFMALRIAVNQEFEELEALLDSIPRLVKPGGRVVVLTFMSLEDRMVKRGFQEMARNDRVKILTRHVVPPAEEEIRSNPPSRSAKLRAVELL
jgi:16S rRNA (cytosine1402-N4)-methyltransferase